MSEESEKEYRVFDYVTEIDITSKLLDLAAEEFTGKVIFEYNFFKGGITNMNMRLDKSIKL